jgi:hypothetical protein
VPVAFELAIASRISTDTAKSPPICLSRRSGSSTACTARRDIFRGHQVRGSGKSQVTPETVFAGLQPKLPGTSPCGGSGRFKFVRVVDCPAAHVRAANGASDVWTTLALNWSKKIP